MGFSAKGGAVRRFRRSIARALYPCWMWLIRFLNPAKHRREAFIASVMDGPHSIPFYSVETMRPGESVFPCAGVEVSAYSSGELVLDFDGDYSVDGWECFSDPYEGAIFRLNTRFALQIERLRVV